MEDLSTRFYSELHDEEALAGKKLARQELVDSHFWTAKNFLADGHIRKGICELENIRTFAGSVESLSREHILNELDFLFTYIHVRTKDDEKTKKNPFIRGNVPACYGFSREEYLELSEKLLKIYKIIGDDIGFRLKLKRFVRVLKKHFSSGELPRIHSSTYG